MSATQLYEQLFNGLTAGSDLDTQGGYAKMAGSGTTDVFVVADTIMEGSQFIAVRNAAASQIVGYEASIGTTRVAGTDHWRVTWKVRLKGGATDSEDVWLTLSAGAGSVYEGISGNNALAIAVRKTTGNVFVRYADDSSLGFQSLSTALGEDDTLITLRVELFPDNTYAILLDANSDGEGWVTMRTGGLLKSGNEAVSRLSVQTNAAASADDTLCLDAIRVLAKTADVQVAMGTRPELQGVLTAAAWDSMVGGSVRITYNIVDTVTGEVVFTGRQIVTANVVLNPEVHANAANKINEAMEADIVLWDMENRLATLDSSGHERTF